MAKDEKELSIRDEMSEFLLYTSPDGKVKVEVLLAGRSSLGKQDGFAIILVEGCFAPLEGKAPFARLIGFKNV